MTPNTLPFGQRILSEIDPDETILEPDQRRKIAALENEEALHMMLYADLGESLKPDLATAEKVFGRVLRREYEIPQMLMTWKFFTLAQTMICVDEGRKLLADKSLTGEEKVNAHRSMTEALRAQIAMTDRVTRMAKSMGFIKKIHGKKIPKVEKKVLRPAPTLAPQPLA